LAGEWRSLVPAGPGPAEGADQSRSSTLARAAPGGTGTADTAGTNTGGSGGTGGGTGTGGSDTIGQGGRNVEGHTVRLVDIFTENGRERAQVQVDGTVYTVDEGEVFADSFQLLSISGDCATMLYGDDQFTICEGEEILK
jgi:hypothetical protein